MTRIAIIAGSGLYALPGLASGRDHAVETAYGLPSAAVRAGTLADTPVLFLPRHGPDHTLPPHRINYRANIRALAGLGATHLLALAAVGGISPAMQNGALVVPDQIIDYTWGRDHTFFDGDGAPVTHVDFTHPYDEPLRQALLQAGETLGLPICPFGVYGAAQGPRLESAAEIERMARDGCDLVGMTGMPEAALAREAGLPYACLAVVVNRAAGRGPGLITMTEIETTLAAGMGAATRLLTAALPHIADPGKQSTR